MNLNQFISYIAGTIYSWCHLIALPAGLLIDTILALLYVYGGKVTGRLMNLYSTIFRGIPRLFCSLFSFLPYQRGSIFPRFGLGRSRWALSAALTKWRSFAVPFWQSVVIR